MLSTKAWWMPITTFWRRSKDMLSGTSVRINGM
jgi:uncharacterized membrane protein